MRARRHLIQLLSVLLLFGTGATAGPAAPQVRRCFASSRHSPRTEHWKAPEEAADVTLLNVGKIQVITNVTVPTLTVIRPASRNANGTVRILPPQPGRFRACNINEVA